MVEGAAAKAMREHAAAAYPQECCGALVGHIDGASRLVTAAWAIDNASEENRERRFTIAPAAYLSVEARARQESVALLGFYHSHPDAPAEPSRYDLLHAWPNLDYIIVSVRRARPEHVTCWRLRDDRAAFAPEEIEWRPES